MRDGAAYLLDAAGRYRITDAGLGQALSAQLSGASLSLHVVAENSPLPATAGMVVGPASMKLQQIIELCERSGHPVLLQEDGQWCGACGEPEIVRALAGQLGATAAAGA
jgi:hypothetical protein